MNRMATALDVNDNSDDRNVHNEEDLPPPPPPKHERQERPDLQYGNVNMVGRNQNPNNVINRVRQNNQAIRIALSNRC